MKRTLVKDSTNKIGEEIILLGWVDTIRDHGKVTFIDLRDRSGIVQVVGIGLFEGITTEDVIQIKGLVKERPENLVNKEVETGHIEVKAIEYEILNETKELPIPVHTDGREIDEEHRLRYRYLDLRRPRMRKILKLRSKFINSISNYLHSQDFVEVETPMLTKSTKEGARDFIVPSRHNPGKFYALPQAPQQYKQLLMTAGVERYFQVAKCIRDEDLRADRGYEFTQLDLEMSFVSRDEVMSTIESAVKEAIASVDGKIKDAKFPVYSYKDAIEKFGDDKFDLRSEKDKENGVLAFAWVVDFPLFKKVDKKDAAEVMDGKSGYTFTHNPFSAPIKEHLKDHLAGKNTDEILTYQYDLVCNGYEVGGGGIRSHKAETLSATFKTMGYSDEEIKESIGHMLEALDLGTPPHGGIALGLDRLVMLLAGETSLKEAIAFPMTSSGKTSVMDAPAVVEDKQLKELHIKVEEK